METFTTADTKEQARVRLNANFTEAQTAANAAQATANAASPASLTINTQTASYTLVLADAGKYVRMSNASALNLTVPPNASVAFAVGAQIPVRQIGAGQLTIVAGDGVTINAPFGGTLVLSGQGASAVLIQAAANVWDLSGDTVAA